MAKRFRKRNANIIRETRYNRSRNENIKVETGIMIKEEKNSINQE